MTSERVCFRGCMAVEVVDGVRRPLHYAGCGDYGVEGPGECAGCVPREAVDGSLICSTCYGRARRLVSDAPELIQRVRGKIMQITSHNGGDGSQRTRASHPSARWEGDPIDAIMALQSVVHADVAWLSLDQRGVEWLSRRVLDRHKPGDDGTRDDWSAQDVMDRWGLEDRPEPHRHVYSEGETVEEQAAPVTEWFDPIISVKQAADRVGVGVREVQRWLSKGLIEPAAKVRGGGPVQTYVRSSEVDEVAKVQASKRKRPFPARAN